MALRTVGARLTLDVSNYMSGLKRAGVATRDFAGGLDKAAKAGKLDKVADSAVKFGIVGAAAFGYVVKSAADFDKQMSAVSAATHAAAADICKLRAAVLEAGKATQFSATQAADGITQLSKAGVSTASILGGGLKGALDLAAAGQMDVGDAAETAASAMTQFKLSGDKVPHLADLLAAGAGKAQGSVHDLSMALAQGGLVAAQMGLSVEDATGTLAAFASAGLLGSDAGTSLKTMFLQLASPTGKAAELMQQLGIKAYDASGRFIGVTKLAGVLRDRLSGLTQEQRNAALATIFGSDAIRAASILYEQGASGIQGWIDKVNDAGYASDTAARLTDNLAGDIERLKGSLETLAIKSGSGANSGLRVLAQGVNGLVNQFLGLPPAIGSSITVLAGVGGVLALGLAGWIKLRHGIASARVELEKMGPAGEKAATGLGKAAGMAGKAAAAFAALQIAGAIVSSFQTELNPQIDAAAKGLAEWTRQCLLSGEAARLFGADSKDLDRSLTGLASHGFSHATDAASDWVMNLVGIQSPLDDAQARVSALDQVLTAMVQAGHGAEALSYLQARAKDTGKSVDDLKKLLPQYSAAIQTAGAATDTAAGQTQNAATATKALGGAASDAKKDLTPYEAAQKAAGEAAKGHANALLDLSSALEGQYNPVVALTNAQKDFKAKQDAAKEAVKKYGVNSQEARQASMDLAGAAITLTGKVGALATDFDGKLSPAMRTALTNAGLTKTQINDVEKAFKTAKTAGDTLADRYKTLPKDVRTNVSTPGLKTADTGVKDYDKKLDGLARQIRTQVNVVGVSGAYAQLKSLLIQQQALKKGISISAATSAFNKNAYSGGGWTGPGPKYQEAGTVHADEYVIRKESRQSIERQAPGALDRMNTTGRLPGYANGGWVLNAPFPVNAAMTRIPSLAEALAVVGPPSGQTYKWMERVVRSAFPGMAVLSDFRPGARTLSGNVSYHALGRAVDFPPSLPLAEWINYTYKSRTRELITPWNSLNIWNGQRHTYTGAIFRQHNFAGGNAHDHWAMARGGLLNEPVYGVGLRSGDSYSLAERGPEWVTPQYMTARGDGYGGGGRPVVVNQTVTVTVPGSTATAQQIAQAVSRELGRQADVYARGAA